MYDIVQHFNFDIYISLILMCQQILDSKLNIFKKKFLETPYCEMRYCHCVL